MNPPRLLPDVPLPRYAFVPGRTPHPVSDPAGHSYGIPHQAPPAPNPAHWQDSGAYLRGIDLFNHGYYWEAHEAWEGLWHACGRAGPAADFLKGLIRLAAAGVKLREGNAAGVRSHGNAALAKFGRLAETNVAEPRQFGLDAAELARHAADLASRSAEPADPMDARLSILLVPSPWPDGAL